MPFRRSMMIKGTAQWMKAKAAAVAMQGRSVIKNFALWFTGFFLLDFFLISSRYDADRSAVKGLIVAAAILMTATLYNKWKKPHQGA